MPKRSLIAALLASVALASSYAPASPAACVSPCDVQANGVSYLAPVTLLSSGSAVRFDSVDESSHPTVESFASVFDRCFNAPVGYGNPAVTVRFDIVEQTVVATTEPGTEFESSAVCSTATETPGSAYVVQYNCLVHAWMRGALVIEPTGV